MNCNKIINSSTSIFLLISCLCQPNFVPYYNYINMLNMFISSTLYHITLEYYPKYTKYSYCYDRFSISLLASSRFFNNELYSFLFSLLSFKYDYIIEISYILGTLTAVYKSNLEYNILMIATLLLSLYFYFNRDNEKWTLKSRLGWHFTQSLYLYLSSYSYKS